MVAEFVGKKVFWVTPPNINSLNLKMMVWKIIFLSLRVIFRFHVNFQRLCAVEINGKVMTMTCAAGLQMAGLSK